MEAKQVIEKILADANAEADKLKKQADEKQADEQAEFDEQLKEHKKHTDALAEKLGSEKKLHLLAAARMNIAKDQLAEKNKILDEVFDQARQQIQSLPDEQYLELITNLVLEAVETGDEEVIIDKEEKRIDATLIEQVNSKLGSDRKGNLKLSQEKMPLGGGFILRRGKVKTNVSFDVLLSRARKELEIDLAKDLFS
ncbi:MAG: V-type ATP synthase subunit E [Planctomycetota bacterium]|jgi:V/A-type H+-transporting ATPase subunit E